MKITEETWKALEAEHLIGKKSIRDIANDNNMPYSTVYYGFKRRGIDITLYKVDKRKYKVNDNYFSSINTEDKAYVLGLLMADGHINKKNEVCLKLKEEDKYVVEYVLRQLSPNKPLFKDSSKKNGKTFHAYKMEVRSDQLCKDLNKLGIYNGKTGNETLPDLTFGLYPHFIRGYFDGDGSISKTNKGPGKSYQIYICCTNKKFLEDTRSLLGFGNIYRESRPTIDMYTFRVNSIGDKVRLIRYMYQDCKSFYMKRKAEKCVNYVNTVLRHCSNVQRNA